MAQPFYGVGALKPWKGLLHLSHQQLNGFTRRAGYLPDATMVGVLTEFAAFLNIT